MSTIYTYQRIFTCLSNYNLLVYFLTHRLSNGANGQSNLHGGSGMLNLDRNVGTSTAKTEEEVNE